MPSKYTCLVFAAWFFCSKVLIAIGFGDWISTAFPICAFVHCSFLNINEFTKEQ